jgi:hypothetical protein
MVFEVLRKKPNSKKRLFEKFFGVSQPVKGDDFHD